AAMVLPARSTGRARIRRDLTKRFRAGLIHECELGHWPVFISTLEMGHHVESILESGARTTGRCQLQRVTERAESDPTDREVRCGSVHGRCRYGARHVHVRARHE